MTEVRPDNARRHYLIGRRLSVGLTRQETLELEALQKAMNEWTEHGHPRDVVVLDELEQRISE